MNARRICWPSVRPVREHFRSTTGDRTGLHAGDRAGTRGFACALPSPGCPISRAQARRTQAGEARGASPGARPGGCSAAHGQAGPVRARGLLPNKPSADGGKFSQRPFDFSTLISAFAMITASLALKINSYVLMAFMIGMCFFPQFMMDQYKMPIPEKEWTMFAWFMQKMGGTMMFTSAVNGALARDQVRGVAVRGLPRLGLRVAFFVVYDYYDLGWATCPSAVPRCPKRCASAIRPRPPTPTRSSSSGPQPRLLSLLP